MKKTLSVLLTFALVLSLVPAFAVHFSAKSVGAWQYDVKNGTAVVITATLQAISLFRPRSADTP